LVSIFLKSVEANRKNGRRRETKIKQEIANLKSQLTILKSHGANEFNRFALAFLVGFSGEMVCHL
jgi:hypothetical protein